MIKVLNYLLFMTQKDFEFSILPNLNGDKQLYLSARNMVNFFPKKLQKIDGEF